LYQFTRQAIKLTVVIIEEYYHYQLHSKLYSVSDFVFHFLSSVCNVRKYSLVIILCNYYISKAVRYYSKQQSPSSQQPVQLMIAGYAKTYSYNKGKMTREY
jgi:hypothetical protein